MFDGAVAAGSVIAPKVPLVVEVFQLATKVVLAVGAQEEPAL